MDQRKSSWIPLTGYDFFAYLTPAVILFTTILFYEFRLQAVAEKSISTPILHFFQTLLELFSKERDNWALVLVLFVTIICISYAAGHVISSISSLLIDRVLIYKGYRYPYVGLLYPSAKKKCGEVGEDGRDPISAPFYRGTYFWANALLFALFFNEINYVLRIYNPATWIVRQLVWLILVVVSITTLVKIYFSNFALDARLKKRSSTGRVANILNSYMCKSYSLFYDAISNLLSKFLNSRDSFSPEFIEIYKKRYKKIFNMNPIMRDTNNFWFPYIYLNDKSPNLSKPILNWLNLYSFARNLSTAFYLAFAYTAVSMVAQIEKIPLSMVRTGRMFFLGTFAMSLIMLVRYYYLYASYFTKFIFRSFVYISGNEDEDEPDMK